MPYKPIHPDIIGWKAAHFIPRQEGATAPVYFPFPILAKHLTEHIQIMIIKQLLVVFMYCKLQLICLDLGMLYTLLTLMFVSA